MAGIQVYGLDRLGSIYIALWLVPGPAGTAGTEPLGGEEARPTGDHPGRHTETEAAVRSGPRSDGAVATGHSMHGVLVAIHSPRQTFGT